jgi:peptidoglycan hydrolase-like protein with peptidoglycan-binding domain
VPTYTTVDPETFIDLDLGLPAHGRGAWSTAGIGFDYRYMLNPAGQLQVGTRPDISLSYWAVAAGVHAIQRRLIQLSYMESVGPSEFGYFGLRTQAGVKAFQAQNKDPGTGLALSQDGTVGRTDSRALWTPLIDAAEKKSSIPQHILRGETMHESGLDVGAVGWFIYYGVSDYRGVDRGMSQINSRANGSITWAQAFDPVFALVWSAARLRTYHDSFEGEFTGRAQSIYWDAAICAHNNPTAARAWVRNSGPTTDAAAQYVTSVREAIY